MSDEALGLELDAEVAECGDVLTGTATWGPLDGAPRRVVVRLGYRTEGRGDSDHDEAAEVSWDGTESGQRRFELPVPEHGPMTYEGRLIRVLWRVELRLDRRLQSDPTEQVPVTILPRGGLALWARATGATPQP